MAFLIPGFKTVDKLYESSRTTIYRAIRLGDDKSVILKICKADASGYERILLRHEFDIITKLNLPGVIRAIALEEYRSSLIMVMEDIDGKSLDQFQLPLPLEQFFEISSTLADAIDAIYKKQIIHKNINPGNIIWNTETGKVQLIDFSLADIVPERTITPKAPAVLEGALEYISPEQTGRMNRVVDYRTDFYSLGVTFYQLLTGRLPFSVPDALGIIHLHIAGIPTAPHELNPVVPEMVSRIVLKMMAKMADDRYQSAWGLRADLERCLRELQSEGKVKYFDLGKEDYTDRLRVPQKLYGRERQTEQLLDAFERVSAGERELFLVAGYSGIGKTALVHEVHRPIAEKKGFFIEGKFEQLQRNVPYYAWIQAFTGFVDYLLMESETEIAHWRASIQNAVGSIGKVVTDVIPKLELIIGPQPEIVSLGPTEAQNRFNYLFLEFVKGIATREHPLVVFLDDLQWIDTASLNLLQTLMSAAAMAHNLIIGAYRDNEVGALHPLTKSIESLRNEKAPVQLLPLGDLSEETVNAMIADTLHVEYSQAVPLTQLIYAKTEGNPFFMLQTLKSLAESGLVSHDVGSRRWKWDINALRSMEITDNVVALMLGKIRKLSAETQHVLTLASCIGFRFSLGNVSVIGGQTEDATVEVLQPALREGLLIPLYGTYQFVHDRVQEAAYALVPETRRKALHLKIGRLLLAQYPQGVPEDQVFEIVDQFNRSIELVIDIKERATLRRLNSMAGRKARGSAAYASGRHYLEQAIALLPPDPWNESYIESLALYQELAECEYLVGNFHRSDELLTMALEMARTSLALAGIYRLRVRLFQVSGRYSDALEVAFVALRLFGVTFPAADKDIQVAANAELRLISGNLRGRRISDLLDIPLASDADTLALIGLLADALPLIYILRPGLWSLFTARAVNISLQRGHGDETSYIYGCHAVALASDIRNILTAQQFSEMAIELNARTPGAGPVRGKTLFLSALVNVWRHHIATSLQLLDQSFQACLDFGDMVYAGYAPMTIIFYHLANGTPLESVVEVAWRYGAFARESRNDVAYLLDRLEQQFALSLQGKTRSLTDFSDDAFDEATSATAIELSGFQLGLAYYCIMKMMAVFIDERFDEALKWIDRAAPVIPYILGFENEAAYHFYHALTLSALHASAPAEQQRQFAQTIAEILGKLKCWADNCPENFANRYFLVSAEIARIDGRDTEAMRFYDQAIRSAQDNNFVHQKALAAEVASRFYRSRGFDWIADCYLRDARDCYARWGAQGKVRQLERLHPWITQPQQSGGEKQMAHLDLSTVMKATHAISSEIEMHRLLSKVVHSIIENAGAQKGFLLMEREGKWVILAQGEIDKTEVEISRPISIEEENIVSLGVVRFVARTQERILLDDVANQGEFVSDPYIRREKAKSLLCAPLLSRGRLIGILYLENNLTTYAFTPERVQFLEMLLSQAATSLENATIYESLKRNRDHLEELVKERTSQLETAKEQAESANRAKSTFLANMSHELRTPLNAILGFARLTKESPDINPEHRKNMDIITLSGGHLLNLINNVLDMSKIESGRMTLERAHLDLYQLIQEMKSLLYVNAEERGLSFVVEQAPELPRRIEVDGGKLRQTLINLIGNAIKYTKQGGVVLRVKLAKRESAEKVWLKFEVTDTGPGISEEDRKQIFQPFVQLRGRLSTETGTGLGLAICRQYVDLMGGQIDCFGEKGKGSVFFFEIPAKELPFEEMAITPERGRVIGLEEGQPRYRLLIAEDQLENRILLHKILEPLGFDIREAVNGKEALEIFEQWRPDLIWMDIRMPVMDGLEATHLIKSTDAGSQTKIIALTAQALEEDRVIIMKAGCDDFVRKPYRNSEIFDVLSRQLGLRFIYEEKPAAPTKKPEAELKPEQLAVLPPELVQQLHKAAIELNPKRTLSLIEQITNKEPFIGDALRILAEKDDYDGLQKILDTYEELDGGT